MSGNNHSSKYYYRYDYYSKSIIYTNTLLPINNSKYKERYNYYYLSYKYLEDINEPYSFEKKEDNPFTITHKKDEKSNSLVPYKFGSFNNTSSYKRPRLLITGKKITRDNSTSTNSIFGKDTTLNSLFGFNEILSSVINNDKLGEDSAKSPNKKLPLEWTEEEKEYEYAILDCKIENITDLIQLGKDYETKYKSQKKRYNLNLRVLSDLVEPLQQLNNMIGMGNIKTAIFNKIILHLQNLDNKNTDFNHIVLCGAPGMGKTHVAKILGKIYTKMGFLSKGDFKEAKITDLKAGYIGQTEIKTQKLLDESKGCVLFFDEAYSLGGDNKFDSYSQSIIDVINPYLDKYKDDFILIVAGYKDDLEHRFFKGNQGLKSRFGLWLEIEKYKPADLNLIFQKKINDYGWKFVEEDLKDKIFEDNKDCFKFFGRDIENLFSKCKLAHAKRVLFELPSAKKIINKDDIKKGLELYLNETQTDLEERRELERIQKSLYL